MKYLLQPGAKQFISELLLHKELLSIFSHLSGYRILIQSFVFWEFSGFIPDFPKEAERELSRLLTP